MHVRDAVMFLARLLFPAPLGDVDYRIRQQRGLQGGDGSAPSLEQIHAEIWSATRRDVADEAARVEGALQPSHDFEFALAAQRNKLLLLGLLGWLASLHARGFDREDRRAVFRPRGTCSPSASRIERRSSVDRN